MLKLQILTLASVIFIAGALSCKGEYKRPETEHITPQSEYSVGNAREWEPLEKQLEIQVRKSVHNGKPALLVEVPNAKVDESTYIEKIGVMTMGGKELAVTEIKRERNPLNYAYFDWQLIPWSGKIKAFVKWNKYDLWVKETDVKDIRGNTQ